MRFPEVLRDLPPITALVLALLSPAAASAYDPARAAAASDPENVAARSVASAPSRNAPRWPEFVAARAAASCDPSNVAAYADVTAERLPQPDATTRDARSAMVSDPENVAAKPNG